MPKVDVGPDHLKPYLFHGVSLSDQDKAQVKGDCPFCGTEGKFGVEAATGKWHCFVCGDGGHVREFLQRLWKESDAVTNGQIKALAEDRRLLEPATLTFWGACVSTLTGDWMLPGFDSNGKLVNLYRWARQRQGKNRLLGTPGQGHGIFGTFASSTYDRKKPMVFICEGPWDGMALWEILRQVKETDDGLKQTGNEASSLLLKANVLAVPGCGSVGAPLERWLPLLVGKRIVLCFDNDHQKENNGKQVEGAGLAASKRAAQIFAHAAEQPAEIHWLEWNADLGFDPTLSDGYDVRDMLTNLGEESIDDIPCRARALDVLLAKIKPIPEGWIKGRSKHAAANGKPHLDCEPCNSWQMLRMAWRKAMKWTDGLEGALAVMLATVTSTKAVGDQLWMKIMSPPSSGKSTLAEALAVNKTYVMSKSTLRGFHSGFSDGSADNHSPLQAMKDKTLVVKDGDTLLQSPNKEQILSEARDVYDRTSRSSYRNGRGKDWEGLNITLLLLGTSSLRVLDGSELGERFLDYKIMERIDDDLEDDILWRVANRAEQSLHLVSSSKETTQEPSLVAAMRLTGGYVSHLRENAQELLSRTGMPEVSLKKCVSYGKFVAYIRARPSKSQDEVQERELGSRLVSQLVRLAKCLAVVLNRPEVDTEVLKLCRKVALDTASGRTLEMVKHLAKAGDDGLHRESLSMLTGYSEQKESLLLGFLRKIEVVRHRSKKAGDTSSRLRWELTPKMQKLYGEVMLDA